MAALLAAYPGAAKQKDEALLQLQDSTMVRPPLLHAIF